ncbi:unnamed protein product [Porites evermanni]|uniref:Capsule synthesis protein CapA domain-containing protein n=1 Tax=Porites evermanni TaxID=104178 RepID=A0ABN8LP09_9CNID|nr:unnamed protein product [Porites evermanni]
MRTYCTSFSKRIFFSILEHVNLLFVGDVSFSVPLKYYVEHGYHSYNDSFNEVAKYVRNADISVANLESPFVSKDMYRYKLKGKSVVLDASSDAASALRFAGFDVVTLANNHFNDFGTKGANFTVEVLKKTGVKYFGVSYGKYDTSQKPLILEVKGIKIGFLGYCDTSSMMGLNCTEIRKLFNAGPAVYSDVIATRDVSNLKKAKVEVIVVFMHFGEELYRNALPYQLHIIEHLMSLGVQVIIGAHPHVLQQHCLHDNKLVAYSLGNFLFHPRRPISGVNPAVYGRFGKKPDKNLIDSYEHFFLGNCNNLKMSQMLKVTLCRNGVLGASYLPVKIVFDPKTKRLHPKPTKDAKWIRVCGKKDKQCEKNCKDPREKKN